MTNKLAQIKKMIFSIRGYQVMLDEDLAEIYQVETRVMYSQYELLRDQLC